MKQGVIFCEVKVEMRKNDLYPRGVYQKKLKYFVTGVMIGYKIQVEENISELKTVAQMFYCLRTIYAAVPIIGDFTLQNKNDFSLISIFV